ncbi:hypothetical protein GCM10020001_015290 [Nonomuraea salmonea]
MRAEHPRRHAEEVEPEEAPAAEFAQSVVHVEAVHVDAYALTFGIRLVAHRYHVLTCSDPPGATIPGTTAPRQGAVSFAALMLVNST